MIVFSNSIRYVFLISLSQIFLSKTIQIPLNCRTLGKHSNLNCKRPLLKTNVFDFNLTLMDRIIWIVYKNCLNKLKENFKTIFNIENVCPLT